MPASPSARASSRPAGPTNGNPSTSSRSPGCSPTSMIGASGWPCPKTVCEALWYSPQPWHELAAAAKESRLRSSGRNCSAPGALVGLMTVRPGSGQPLPMMVSRARSIIAVKGPGEQNDLRFHAGVRPGGRDHFGKLGRAAQVLELVVAQFLLELDELLLLFLLGMFDNRTVKLGQHVGERPSADVELLQ